MASIPPVTDRFLRSRHFYFLCVGADGSLLGANPLLQEQNKLHADSLRSGDLGLLFSIQDADAFLELIHRSNSKQETPLTGIFEFKNSGIKVLWEVSLSEDSGIGKRVYECIGIRLESPIQKGTSDEKRLEAIISNSVDIQFLIDASALIFYCSPNVTESLGYLPDELVGRNGFDFIFDEDKEKAKYLLQNELALPGKNRSEDIRFLKKDGSLLWAEVKGRNLLSDPSVGGLLINLNDISDRKKLEEELLIKESLRHKEIAQAAVDAQEKERADIGKELHDNISQMLTSTKLFLDILKNKQPDELLERSVNNINAIIQEVRSLSRSLVPSSISDLGLVASMNDLLENIRAANVIDIEFYPADEAEMPLSPNSKLTLYRIAQEQINNIVRHSEAKQVYVELFPEDGKVEMVIADNGRGFDLNTVKPGMGLKNIRSRAELLNGKAEIVTDPGKGCKLKVVIPLT